MAEMTAKELEKVLNKISEETMTAVTDGLLMAAELAVGALDESTKRNLNKHGKSGRSRSSVSGSSGLAGSWKAVFVQSSGRIAEVGAYSHLPYAAIHEGGGVIHKKNKYLTIPLTDSARDYGAREFPQELNFIPAGPNTKPNVVGILAATTAAGVVPQYALASQVTIPATEYISEAAEDVQGDVAEVLKDTLLKDLIKPIVRSKG